MRFLAVNPGHVEHLPVPGSSLSAAHVFEKAHIDAINAALGAGRPLLVRGEPGIGKSQLARAAAQALKRNFLSFVADARSESRDLLWSFDAVARLADAQARVAEKDLSVDHYVTPGVLWWAFNWKSAGDQARLAKVPQPPQSAQNSGAVVLIDEIDKADTDVPNGLLEALGSGQFCVRGRPDPICIDGEPPLVIITTNEERVLPDAFVRRCLVLHLSMPVEVAEVVSRLESIGHAHFGTALACFNDSVATNLLRNAADLVAQERKLAHDRHWRPLPGQAEYIDLVRSVLLQADGNQDRIGELLATVGEFTLIKSADAAADRARRVAR